MPYSLNKIKNFFEVYNIHPSLKCALNLVYKSEFEAAAREVRRVGCNIDQLLVIARAKNWMIAKDLEKALERSRAVEKLIVDTYTSR